MIDDLFKEMGADSKIDISKLEEESIKIPSLHSKWSKFYYAEIRLEKAIETELKILFRKKYEFYLGRGADDEYKNRPLNLRITKTEIDIYINSDDEYVSLLRKLESTRSRIKIIEDFIKQINQRSFNIKNAIDFLKFKNGIN